MVDSRVVSEWLAKAEEDYLFTEKLIGDEESFFAPLCFHCQQAAEKYLKAYVVAHSLQFRKTHDLVEILELCKEKDKEFTQLDDDVRRLSGYYVDTRYPTTWPVGYIKDDAFTAFAAAGRIREFIKTKLAR